MKKDEFSNLFPNADKTKFKVDTIDDNVVFLNPDGVVVDVAK